MPSKLNQKSTKKTQYGKIRRNYAKLRRNYAKLRRNFCRIVWSILVETMVLSCFVMFCHLNRASGCVQTVLPFDTAPVLPNGSLNCELPFATRIWVLLCNQVVEEKGNIFIIFLQELQEVLILISPQNLCKHSLQLCRFPWRLFLNCFFSEQCFFLLRRKFQSQWIAHFFLPWVDLYIRMFEVENDPLKWILNIKREITQTASANGCPCQWQSLQKDIQTCVFLNPSENNCLTITCRCHKKSRR